MEYWQGHDSSHQVRVITQDHYEEFGRSGRQYCAVYSYARDYGVGTDQLGSGHREVRELPIEESETRAVYRWAGNSEEAVLDTEPFSIAQTAAERSHSRLTLIPGFDVNAERWQSFGFNVQDVEILVVSTCDAWRAALLELPDIQPFTPRGFGSRLAFSPPESGKGRQKK